MAIYNQYQDKFLLTKNKYIIDYLEGDLYKYPIDEKFEFLYDEEAAILDNSYKNASYRLNSPELTITLIPTYKCNMKCVYCYEGNLTGVNEDASTSDIHSIIKFIEELYNKNYYKKVKFVLLGGEPITNDNIIWFKKFFSILEKLI
ncbi:MAG: 4Fe-4S cluster-binding domain-containing protein [Tissierellia bacterium]|nr:4Fe-4S cluster-binding domain-containing protein [Tissierellia bacterium]